MQLLFIYSVIILLHITLEFINHCYTKYLLMVKNMTHKQVILFLIL
jgi:hypothetical protein